MGRPNKTDRDLLICEQAYNGRTPTDIGKEHNLSRTRVTHIIEDNWKLFIKKRRNAKT